MVLAAGEEFAGYTIESVLGTGGMGAVYLAKHPRLPRRDALKLLNPAFSNDPNFRARFEREADLASGLIHRNIVAVYDRGAVDGQLWISMQYVAGVDASVAARAGDGSMTPHRVVHIISEVGAGLDFAHRSGLLHRDVKPANILLAAPDDPSEPEHVLLTDFGIAKSTDEVQHLTGTGNLLATLAYASPEQIEARPLDHRVDIYALGCVLYELLTGSVPFPESSPFATMTAHLKNPPPRPSEKVPWLPPGFDAVVAKAMAKNPDDRYNSCRELSLAARAALAAGGSGRVDADPRGDRGAAGAGTRRWRERPHLGRPVRRGRPAAARRPVEAMSLTTPRPPYTVVGPADVPGPGHGRPNSARSAPTTCPTSNRIELEELLHEARFFDLPPRLPLVEVVPGRRAAGDHRRQQRGHPHRGLRAGGRPATQGARRDRQPAGAAGRLADHPAVHRRCPRAAGRAAVDTDRDGGAAGRRRLPVDRGLPAGRSDQGGNRPAASIPAPVNGPTGCRAPARVPAARRPDHSGPHTGGYPQQFARRTAHRLPPPTVPDGWREEVDADRLAAVLVIAGGATAAMLLTRQRHHRQRAAQRPTGLTAIADGRDVTVTWNGSLPARPATR